MTIDKKNAEIVNSKQIYLHDDILIGMFFCRIRKVMVLEFRKHVDFDKTYKIELLNVIGFEMSSCDFWGQSECVFDFEYIENSQEETIIPKLKSKWREFVELEPNDLYNSCFEIMFTFTSGDCLRIACEKIKMETGDGGLS